MDGVSTWGQGGFRKSVKAAVLARDPICVLGYPGCTYYSTECDHVVSIALLGIARRDANEQIARESAIPATSARPAPKPTRRSRCRPHAAISGCTRRGTRSIPATCGLRSPALQQISTLGVAYPSAPRTIQPVYR